MVVVVGVKVRARARTRKPDLDAAATDNASMALRAPEDMDTAATADRTGIVLAGRVAAERSADAGMAALAGKVGLIVGVANKRSLSWAIAQAAAGAGATLVITYQGRFEEHVNELAATLSPKPLVVPLDVQNDTEIHDVFSRIQQEHNGLDFVVHGVAFANRDELASPFVETSRDGFKLALDISAYSLIALARGAKPLMEAKGGGSILTLTYLGSQRVFTNYNVMGVAKAALESSVRYLAADLGAANIRVNAISAGPIKTLAAAGIGGFSTILGIVRERAPLKRTIEASEVADAAVFLLGNESRGITGEILMVDAGYHAIGM
jgi:enoyl-[acyl-carrier protein] reductase I